MSGRASQWLWPSTRTPRLKGPDEGQGQGGGGARDALRFTGTEDSTSGERPGILAEPGRAEALLRDCLPTLLACDTGWGVGRAGGLLRTRAS